MKYKPRNKYQSNIVCISDTHFECIECRFTGTRKAVIAHFAKMHDVVNLSKPKKTRAHWSHTPWNKGKSVKTNPELTEKLRAGGLGFSRKVKNESFRPKIADLAQTNEYRKQKSNWRKQLHKDFPEKHPNRILASRGKKTQPEVELTQYLEAKNIRFQFNQKVGKYYPDFLLLDHNLIIETDGVYWHKNKKEHDFEKDQYYNSIGYKVIRIPVSRKLTYETIDKYLKGFI